jgi:hypothetical protein
MSLTFPVIKAHLFEPVCSVLTFQSIFNVYLEAQKVAGMEPYVTDVTTISLKSSIVNFQPPTLTTRDEKPD